MMNKQVFLTVFCAIGLTTMMAHGSVAAKNNSATLPPMFALGIDHGMMQVVYWTYTDEPHYDAEYDEFYEIEHQAWQLQENLRHNAELYTKLIVDGYKTRDVKYVDEILLNPDGEKMFPGELHGRPQIPSPGARYALLGEPALNDEEDPGIVIVTDSYLATHRPMTIKPASEEEILPLPANVIKKMEDTYGMTVERSVQSSIIGDRYMHGVLQFKGEYKHPQKDRGPDYKAALALEIITDGNKIYSYPVEGYYFPDEGPTWNADDGGEYFPSQIVAAFEGPQGPEFCFIHWAPESATTGMFTIQGNELVRQLYAVYHTLIDENFPIWKKDIEEMKRLYIADDPYENENVELTKCAHVFIDWEGEQIWISDEAEENGAFFSREDGELKLITTVRGNLKPSFPESRDGNNYLIVSGPAGGPSYYTEVFKLQRGKVVEKFNVMEIYGEIDECSLNGKTISAEEGKAYLKAIPEAREPFIFWEEINNKQ